MQKKLNLLQCTCCEVMFMKSTKVQCISDCERLSIANGHLDSTDKSVGTVVTVRCEIGYTLVGSSWRECLSSKTWSGETKCLGMKYVYIYTNIRNVLAEILKKF